MAVYMMLLRMNHIKSRLESLSLAPTASIQPPKRLRMSNPFGAYIQPGDEKATTAFPDDSKTAFPAAGPSNAQYTDRAATMPVADAPPPYIPGPSSPPVTLTTADVTRSPNPSTLR